MVAVADVSRLSLDARAATPTFDVMRPIEEVPVVAADRPLVELVLAVSAGNHDRMMVVRDGEVLGALTSGEIADWASGGSGRSTGAMAEEAR